MVPTDLVVRGDLVLPDRVLPDRILRDGALGIVDAGRRAIARGATVHVLGCAGMAPTARALERELGIAVVEPVEAGTREAAPAAAHVA
jgi:Asp/Glu/hydantoin racemase